MDIIRADASAVRAISTTILLAGIGGAALDAAYFSAGAILKGHSPAFVLMNIAQFWLGVRSLHMGATSAALGLVTHVALSILMAAGFIFIVRRSAIASRSTLVSGAAYGALLYVIMYLVVLPLRWPAQYPRWHGWSDFADITVHLLMGVTFALVWRATRGGAPDPWERPGLAG